jgi:hypothetical protein
MTAFAIAGSGTHQEVWNLGYYRTSQTLGFSATAGNILVAIYSQEEYRASAFSDPTNGTWNAATSGTYSRVFWAPVVSTAQPLISWTQGGPCSLGQSVVFVELVPPAGTVSIDTQGQSVSSLSNAIHSCIVAARYDYPTASVGSGFTELAAIGALQAGNVRHQYLLDAAANNSCAFGGPVAADTAVAFKVTVGGGSTPTLTSITPSNGYVNSTQSIALVGTNLGGGSQDITISGSNVTVANKTYTSSTNWSADLVIGGSATPGARTITVSTVDGSTTIPFTVLARGSSTTTSEDSTVTPLKLNAARSVYVRLKDSAGAGKTGLTLVIKSSKNGAAPATITPTVTELDSVNWPGVYVLALTAGHTDTAGFMKLYITGTGAVEICPEFDVQETLAISTNGASNWAAFLDAGGSATPTATLANLTPAGIASAMLDAVAASYNTAGSVGAKINAAALAGDPWTAALPGAYSAGSAGYILGTNLNATISSRLPTSSYTTPPTAAANATATWAATRSGNNTSGTMGEGVMVAPNAITSSVVATDAIGAAQLATAAVAKIWTQALTEAYATDGAQFTGAQALYMLWSLLAEATATGSTLTAKKLDGSTAMIFTLNTASPATATGLTRTS